VKDIWIVAKAEWKFAFLEVKAGYIRFWHLFWAMLAAPFKVGIEFARGKGRWVVHPTSDPDTQLEALGFERPLGLKRLRAFGVGGSAYYRFCGMLNFVNSVLLVLYLCLRVASFAAGHFRLTG
jgi:hypothetical protein